MSLGCICRCLEILDSGGAEGKINARAKGGYEIGATLSSPITRAQKV